MAKFGKIDALVSLGFKFYGSEDVGFTFYDSSGNPIDDEPTDAEIDAEVTRMNNEWTANEYQRDRAKSFPSWQDQLDMQYHDQLDGTTTWKDAIAKVKSGNPKPE